MRWKPKVKPVLKVAQMRTRYCFAWIPRRMSDGTVVWLEGYCVEERVSKYTQYWDMDSNLWHDIVTDDDCRDDTVLRWQFVRSY